MMRGMFSAVSGLKTQQVMLDVAANDLANVNTVGYKAARTTFKDQLQQLVRTSSASGAGFGGANAAQIGLGVGLGTIDNLMSGGAVQATGNALDLAIQGDGWFRTGPGTPTPGTPAAGTPAQAVMTVRLRTETTKAVPSTRTTDSRAPLAAARCTAPSRRSRVCGEVSMPRRCTRSSAWPENCTPLVRCLSSSANEAPFGAAVGRGAARAVAPTGGTRAGLWTGTLMPRRPGCRS